MIDLTDDGVKVGGKREEKLSFWQRVWNWIKRIFGL